MIDLPGYLHSGDIISVINHKGYHTGEKLYLTSLTINGQGRAQFVAAGGNVQPEAQQWIAKTYLYVRPDSNQLFTIPPPAWPPTLNCLFQLAFPSEWYGKHILSLASQVIGIIPDVPRVVIDLISRSSAAVDGRLRSPFELDNGDKEEFTEVEVYIRISDAAHADTFNGITVKVSDVDGAVPGVLTTKGAQLRENLSCFISVPRSSLLEKARHLTFDLVGDALDPCMIAEVYVLEHTSQFILQDEKVNTWIGGATKIIVGGYWERFNDESAPVPLGSEHALLRHRHSLEGDACLSEGVSKTMHLGALPAIGPRSNDMNAARTQAAEWIRDNGPAPNAGVHGLATRPWNRCTAAPYEIGYRAVNFLEFIREEAQRHPAASRLDVINAYFPDGNLTKVQTEMLAFLLGVDQATGLPSPYVKVDLRNDYVSLGNPTVPMPIELAVVAALSGAAIHNATGCNDTIANLINPNTTGLEWQIKVFTPHAVFDIPPAMAVAEQQPGGWRSVVELSPRSQGVMICFREQLVGGGTNPWRVLAWHTTDNLSMITSPGHPEGISGSQEAVAAIVSWNPVGDVQDTNNYNVLNMRVRRNAAKLKYPVPFYPDDIVKRLHVHGHYGVPRFAGNPPVNGIPDRLRYDQLAGMHHFVSDWYFAFP